MQLGSLTIRDMDTHALLESKVNVRSHSGQALHKACRFSNYRISEGFAGVFPTSPLSSAHIGLVSNDGHQLGFTLRT